MSTSSRVTFGVFVLAIVIMVAVIVSLGGGGYRLRLQLANAGGLIGGSPVRVDGVPVGEVTGLHLNHDRLTATLRIDHKNAIPGRDASAVVEVNGLFGQPFVALDRGDVRDPLPSGSTIPQSRTAVSVRLDDLIDAANPPTRAALGVFLGEYGQALVGRGQDLGAVLVALPPALSSTRKLIAQFAANTQILGRLVDQSDQVVTSVANERSSLGRLVASAAGALQTLASRNGDLRATVNRAPATLASAQRALASLQGAAAPLIPAAEGLRATAAPLTQTLRQLPGFTSAANPTLATIRRVAPQLQRLGRLGTPPARRLVALADELVTYTGAVDPASNTLNEVAPNALGTMEGWARSTQPYDAASHVFRFGVSDSADIVDQLLPPAASAPSGHRARPQHAQTAPRVVGGPSPTPAPASPASTHSSPVTKLLGGVGAGIGKVLHSAQGVVSKLTGTAAATPPSPGGVGGTVSAVGKLLHYLLGP
jgi:virulence factor Mce-like protein